MIWFGWKWLFFLFGGVGFVWLVPYWLFVFSSPDEDRYIHESEMKRIREHLPFEEEPPKVSLFARFLLLV